MKFERSRGRARSSEVQILLLSRAFKYLYFTWVFTFPHIFAQITIIYALYIFKTGLALKLK